MGVESLTRLVFAGCASLMDELRAGTEGDMRRRPLATDLLTVGEGRKEEEERNTNPLRLLQRQMRAVAAHEPSCQVRLFARRRVNTLPSTRPLSRRRGVITFLQKNEILSAMKTDSRP